MNNFVLLIFGIAGLLAVGAVLLLILFKPKKKGLSSSEFQKYWTKIKILANSENIFEVKQAVMEADKLLDRVLKARTNGNNLGERLRNAKGIFKNNSSYQQLWEAHKIRNRLAHEVDFEVSKETCRQIIQKFAQGFRELGY